MMITASSLIILVLSCLAVVCPNLRFGHAKKTMTDGMHRAVCIGVFILGCLIRLYRLGDLPEGIFAEEALLGVQAKALWQTGGFLFDGNLTTQFEQWAGESAGPLLATLTAPFVGAFGMGSLSVRLPLALLSCVSMAAVYGLGEAIGGKRAGRWCLTAYAICPYFVLMSRMACSANAAVFLLPIALYATVKGMDKPPLLYVGMILIALLAYAQNMYFFIAPIAVLIISGVSVAHGMKRRHVFGAAAAGMLVCLPAVMTLWVNLHAGESFTWLGFVKIPVLNEFDKADSLLHTLSGGEIQEKIWAVLVGSVFQALVHMNISPELFIPTGMGALYVLSIPLMILGGFEIVDRVLKGRGKEYWSDPRRLLIILLCATTLLMLILYGSVGLLDKEGATSVFDYSSFLLYDVLLMAAGLSRIEKKSCLGISVLSGLFVASFIMLCVHLFGPAYQENANVYFSGFAELSQKAKDIQNETGAKVNVTGTVYPHIAPSDAAEVMYLYAADVELNDADFRESYEVIYAPGIETPDMGEIYLIAQNDLVQWNYDMFTYEEDGDYILLSPLKE